MRIALTGADGFIGRKLRTLFENDDIEVLPVSRKDFKENLLRKKLQYCDGIIHLAGESISGFWTVAKKRRIYESRVETARKLVDCAILLKERIQFFVTISGVGIYDSIHTHTEGSSQLGNDFLARVIKDWEGETKRLKREDIRTVIVRSGIVLGKCGGILSLLMKSYKAGIGLIVLSDKKLPLIHIDDLCRIFYMAATDVKLEGVFNAVTTNALSIESFFRILEKARRPWFSIKIRPDIVKMILGESSILIIDGQNVIPERLGQCNFTFIYSDATEALRASLL